MKVIKKDGTLEDYNEQKIVNAVHKSAARAMVELTESQYALKEKNIWVEKYFPYMHRGNRLFVPQNIRKSEYVRALVGDVNNDYVLLDDYSKNLHDWVSAGGRGIKLLNGSNGTVGSWKGPSVSRFSSPKDIQKAIMGYVN